jgi:protein SCO1/2
MLRTALLCAVLLWASYAAATRLTHGFQAWTDEEVRRLEVARAPVPTPPVAVEGASAAAPDLRALLANGRDVTVVEFVYTRCETLCLVGGAIFQQMQEALRARPAAGKDAGRVQLLSIGFDPARDSPAELAAYARRMHADPRWWQVVRVPQAADLRQLLDAFRVVVVPSGHGDFEHNAALLVVDRQGRLVRIFDLAQQQLALDYALHLAQGGTP